MHLSNRIILHQHEYNIPLGPRPDSNRDCPGVHTRDLFDAFNKIPIMISRFLRFFYNGDMAAILNDDGLVIF